MEISIWFLRDPMAQAKHNVILCQGIGFKIENIREKSFLSLGHLIKSL